MRHAVVTGGAGFIGTHLCAALLQAGYRVSCVDNFVTSNKTNIVDLQGDERFTVIESDVTEEIPIAEPVDLVLHLASAASPRDYHRLPLQTLLAGSAGTRNALLLAERDRARFVLASTSEVYGDPLRHPQQEDYWGNVNPVGPRSVYDEAKRYAEALTAAHRRERGANTGIARIFNSYGPGMRPDDGRMIPTFIRQALAAEPITVNGDGNQTRSVCFVEDTVRGMHAMAESTVPGPVNIGSPDELPVNVIAERIRELTGSNSRIDYLDAVEDDPKRRCPDISKAKLELGWAPRVSMTEGLAKTVDWLAW